MDRIMFSKYIIGKLLGYAMAISLTALNLVACGGGGGSGSAPVVAGAVPKAAGVTYTLFTEEYISSGSVTFDIDGGILNGTTTYTLASTANGGCSFTSNPANLDTPVCSSLAGGQAYLLCDNTTGEYFNSVLFKASVVDASINEITGLSLPSVSCGIPSIRPAIRTINFNMDGSIVERTNGSSNTYDSANAQELFSVTGSRYFDYQHRYVLKKLVEGSKTTFFLLDLYENIVGTETNYGSRIYVLVK
jgi:hypothetical protein